MRNLLVVLSMLLVSCSGGTTTPKDGQRTTLLMELRKCLDELPLTVSTYTVAPCAGRDVTLLDGVPADTLLKALGEPTWCRAGDGLNFLDRGDCLRSQGWGYSFYRLPSSTLGGGPELTVNFDRNKKAKAGWTQTQ